MLSTIPPPKAKIQASNEGHRIVYDNKLLMMRPVKGHVPSILKDVVVGMSQNSDVTMSRGSFWAQCVKSMLCVGTVATDRLSNFLVHYDVYLHPGLCPPLEDLIQPPFLVVVGRSPQEELWTQPPILDVDGLLGLLQGHGDSIEVVLSIDVPFDLVAIPLGGEGFEAVTLGYLGSLVIGSFLVLLVMTVVGVDDVPKLADLVLEVDGANFGIVKVGVWWGTCCQQGTDQGAGSCVDKPFNWLRILSVKLGIVASLSTTRLLE